MEKGKPGRKRKLSNLSEEEYKQISLWSGDGLNESQIATLLNVNISTITREKKRNEQFAHAIKKGKYKAVQLVANKVFQNAMDGKETSAIFFLKNREDHRTRASARAKEQRTHAEGERQRGRG